MRSTIQRHQRVLVYSGVALTAVYAGMLVSRNQQTMAMSLIALLALGGLVILVNLPVTLVFTGWLFLAPLFQATADAVALGRSLTWALYIAPLLLFAALTALHWRSRIAIAPLDWLPGVYVCYVVASIFLTSDIIQADPPGAARSLVTLIAIGPIIYYFLVFGPGVDVSLPTIVATLLSAAALQGLMAVLEIATGWNLWGQRDWLEVPGGARATATLANPGVTGMFLGVGIALAVAVLTWRGPSNLRRLAWIVLLVATPGLMLTLTRGPILATALAVVLLLVLGRSRMLGLGALAAGTLVLALVYPALENTSVYHQRATETGTLEARVVVQDVSLQLAAEKPLTGWGHGRFDEVKNASEFTAQDISIKTVLATTSHDTYLTILVELGVLGLLIFSLPFLVLSVRTLRWRGPPQEHWLRAGSLGSLLVIFLSGATLDFRFFSFALMIPFVFLAMLRRLTAVPGARPRP